MIKHIWKFCWKKKLKTQSQYFVNIYEAIHKFISFESHLNLRIPSTWNLFIIIKQVHSTANWIVTGLGFFICYPHPLPPPPPNSAKDDWNSNPQSFVGAHWKIKSEGFVLCRHLGKSCAIGQKFFQLLWGKTRPNSPIWIPSSLAGVGVQIKNIMKNCTSLEKLDLIAVQIKLDPQPI